MCYTSEKKLWQEVDEVGDTSQLGKRKNCGSHDRTSMSIAPSDECMEKMTVQSVVSRCFEDWVLKIHARLSRRS
jgi:hypothetical protein